jgi:hypothetical protein
MQDTVLNIGDNATNCSISKHENNFKIISSKKDILMTSLISFFSNRTNLDRVIPIITGKSTISLRILDWFVTNYSKKNNVNYQITHKETKKTSNFIVYLDYKSQLKAYSKHNFDPFCRRERISFIDHDSKELITTVGQLNFFRWAIENDILEYIVDNYKIIENDMNDSLKNLYKKDSNDKSRRKRTELSVSATKTVNKHNVSILVQFD